jgi:hypothetical protein
MEQATIQHGRRRILLKNDDATGYLSYNQLKDRPVDASIGHDNDRRRWSCINPDSVWVV